MKKLIIAIFLVLAFGAGTLAQAPTKLFDVRGGNGIVDGGQTQAQADYIAYKDVASVRKLADAFATAYGFTSVANPAFNDQLPEDPVTNPRTIAPTDAQKRAHMRRKITDYIRDIYKAQTIAAAAKTAGDGAATTAEGELPPQ